MRKYLRAFVAALCLATACARPFSAARVNVSINFAKPDQPPAVMTGYGSAFLVRYRGHEHLITAGHVCEMALAGDSKLSLSVVGGRAVVKTEQGGIEVARISERADLCELRAKLPLPALPALELASDDPAIGAQLTIEGAPFGTFPARTLAYFSGRMLTEGRAFGFGAGLAAPGNSGSPVIDDNDKVQGVLVMGAAFIFLYVPHDQLRSFLEG